MRPGATPRSSSSSARCSTRASSPSCSAATTRSPSRTSARPPSAMGRSGSSTSTPTPTPGGRCSASRSRTARPCSAWSRPGRSPQRYVQVGLRGYWPGEREFAWQAEHGITSFFMHDVRELGIAAVVERTVEIVGEGPAYLTVDVDVLDPAFAPGTGTPEPGGMTSGDLLWACREVARRLELVGAEVVEVIPTAVGSADVTAVVADRIVREILNGVALRRR